MVPVASRPRGAAFVASPPRPLARPSVFRLVAVFDIVRGRRHGAVLGLISGAVDARHGGLNEMMGKNPLEDRSSARAPAHSTLQRSRLQGSQVLKPHHRSPPPHSWMTAVKKACIRGEQRCRLTELRLHEGGGGLSETAWVPFIPHSALPRPGSMLLRGSLIHVAMWPTILNSTRRRNAGTTSDEWTMLNYLTLLPSRASLWVGHY
jgi:hypothetical protein